MDHQREENVLKELKNKCLENFRKQYPNMDSGDYQAFVLGMQAIIEELHLQLSITKCDSCGNISIVVDNDRYFCPCNEKEDKEKEDMVYPPYHNWEV